MTLAEIVSLLKTSRFPHLVWVARNYSKADLIRDLETLASEKGIA